MKHMKRAALAAAALLAHGAMAQNCPAPGAPLAYPVTRTVDQQDNYHGTVVADPYRWLEDANSADTQAWVEAQNKLTQSYLSGIAGRDAIKARLTKLWNYERFSVPFKEGGRYFYSRNDGLQNQSVLYTMQTLADVPRLLLDPNTLAADGTVALADLAVSPTGKYLAYSTAASGSDWNEIHVRDIDSGKDIDDVIKWVKFSRTAWLRDGSGFFYSRYDEPKVVSASVVNSQLIVDYLSDAHSLVKVYDLKGKLLHDVALPGLGTAGGFGGKRADTETFYSYTSFTTPTTIYRYDLKANESSVYRQPKVDFDPDAYETRQEFYTSRDGTKVPMFIVSKKGLKLDGSNPTYLYGYGGFNISLTPSFSVANLAWLEMGGVYVMANLRGGGEYGESWHAAGTRLHKQNVFDDFIGAAEWLIAHKVTSPAKLSIGGGSNGGLLVGATMTQRPDLFAAALPQVGVMDMLRFHKFTIGWAWTSDYGSSDNADEFQALYKYSPLHNLKKGTCYPATMITTADHDDRVVPAHSFKFAATAQADQAPGGAPILIRIESKAGHGAGKPTTKQIEEVADRWGFLSRVLHMDGASAGTAMGQN